MAPRRYFFRAVSGQVVGPVSLNAVAEMIRSGQLKANTPVSLDGQDFKPMKAFPELATLLSVDVDLPDASEGDDLIEAPATYSGSILEVSLPKLLFTFSAAKASGRLVLQNELVRKQVYLQNGKAVAALSSDPLESLNHFLVSYGGMDAVQVEKLYQQAGLQDDLLADMVVHRGLLQPHQLFEILRELLLQKIYELFSWRVGSYGFYDGQLYKGSILPLNLNPWEVVAEGVRRGYTQEELQALLGPLRNHVLVARDSAHIHLNQLVLTPRELKVFKAVGGGGRTLAGVLEHLAADEDSERTVLTMVYLGIELELIGIGEAQEAAAASSEDAAAWDAMLGEGSPPPSAPPNAPASPIRPTPPVSGEERALLDLFNSLKAQDHFLRLGLDREATASQASKAFMKAAREHHPDQQPTDLPDSLRQIHSDIFALLNEAHQVLSDDKKRQDYLDGLEVLADGVDVKKIMEAELMFQRAEVLVSNRKFPEALKLLDDALKLNPDEGEFHIFRGYAAFCARSNPDRTFREHCVQTILKGLKMRENNVPAGHLFLGRIYLAAEEMDKAASAFKKALALDRNNLDAARELRLLESRTKDRKSIFGRKK